jgi:ATP-dependent Clp endopeptidase proteolytic subunit ClpP
MPNDDAVLRYCHAWQTQEAADADHKSDDDDVDDQKNQYMFPHHRKEDGPANIPACNNGKSRLSNANIPEADKPGVEKHLQAHIDDSKKDSGGADNSLEAARPMVAMRFPGEKRIDIVALAGTKRWQRAVALGTMTDDQRAAAHLPRAKRLSNRVDWLRIKDYTDGTPARVDIYDEIGWSFWDEGITASSVAAQLQAIEAPSIELHINSPGGDVFDGIAILNLFRAFDKPIDVVIDGVAASAASFIAQCGDTVTAMPQSQMMIHDASGICLGNAADMTEMAELLDHMSQNIADVYAMRSGVPADEWRTAMKAETWYSADEAVAAGLADKVGVVQRGQKQPDTEPEPAVANHWNMSFYNYSGREAAPSPVLPTGHSGESGSPVAGTAAPVHNDQDDPQRGRIDPAVVRNAFAGAFKVPTPKEARP